MRYIIAALFLTIVGLGAKIYMDKKYTDNIILNHVNEIQSLRNMLDNEKAKNAVSLANESVYVSVIEDLNKKLEEAKVDVDKKKLELEKWKSKPDDEKYKKLYDRISKVKEKEDECQRYKDTANAFNGLDLNKL